MNSCPVCLGTRWVRKNPYSGVMLPWLPKHMRDVDREGHILKDEPCPKCNADGEYDVAG